MDKSWINLSNRLCDEYWRGAVKFLEVAARHVNSEGEIRCPCRRCVNQEWLKLNRVEAHIIDNGFNPNYTVWVYHGEKDVVPQHQIPTVGATSSANVIRDELTDVLLDLANEMNFEMGGADEGIEELDEEAMSYDENFEELKSELWPGCKSMSSLNFLVKLMHLKVMHKWTNRSFDMLCQLLKISHPEGNKVPDSHYDARRKLRAIGLGYESIHVCKYDCALFWKENALAEICPVCKTSRWVPRTGKGKKVPHKVLRYFPIKARLRRLYSSRHTASAMRWHQRGRSNDPYVMRHPVDGQAWKDFDSRYPQFATDPRNVRLGLAADGFNPFGNMAIPYSMWPVVLTTYNLPPWLCLKVPYLMLTLLIPGPSAPAKDMDVFLRPLIEELKQLWDDGVVVRDAVSGNNFKLHAALLWTINDFPARSSLSGWSG